MSVRLINLHDRFSIVVSFFNLPQLLIYYKERLTAHGRRSPRGTEGELIFKLLLSPLMEHKY